MATFIDLGMGCVSSKGVGLFDRETTPVWRLVRYCSETFFTRRFNIFTIFTLPIR